MIIVQHDKSAQQPGGRDRVIPVLLDGPSAVMFKQKFDRLGRLTDRHQPRRDLGRHISLVA